MLTHAGVAALLPVAGLEPPVMFNVPVLQQGWQLLVSPASALPPQNKQACLNRHSLLP